MVNATVSKPESWRVGVELAITALFWGVWLYFILPLLSLMLWFAGIYIFVEQMVLLGGYQSFLDRLFEYGLVILGMMLLTLIWINWNKQYHGLGNKRARPPAPVTNREVAEFAGVPLETIESLHRHRRAVVYFNDRDQLVLVGE
jgi:poly-beta-1,6-N-acetyl-D-glucosamine biosynthesis protein PgaD